jgi:hypothetical protein
MAGLSNGAFTPKGEMAMAAMDLRNLGSTKAGSGAALKALHPAWEAPAYQWPDRNTADTVTFQSTEPYNITANSLEGSEDKAWNCNIYLSSFVDNFALITRWRDGETQPDPNQWKALDTQLNDFSGTAHYILLYSKPWDALGGYPADEFQAARVTARSVTLDLVASALANQGTIYAGQAQMDVQVQSLKVDAEAIIEEVLRRVRHQDLGETDSESESDFVHVRRGLRDFDIDKTNDFVVIQALPNTYDELTNLDTKWYQANACDGVYLPLRHSAASNVDMDNCSQQYHLCNGFPNQENTGRTGHHVMMGKSWQWGFVMIRGLDPIAKLNTKFINCIEAVALNTGLLAKMAKPAPPLDQEAIDRTQEIMCRLPSAFPASANFLGGLLDEVAGALAGFIPGGELALKGLRGLDKMTGYKAKNWLDSIF